MAARWVECFYCRQLVDIGSIERDHFPVPKRHGGTATVEACKPCHTMKDRISLADWPVAASLVACESVMDALDRDGRLLLGRFLALMHDVEASHAAD